MSYSPTTPDNHGENPNQDRAAVSAYLQTASRTLHEPSPASTYGDTVAGDSMPATPQEHGHHDPAVVNSLRTMHLGSNLEQTEADATKPESSNRYHRAERRLDPTRGELVEPHSPHNVGGSGSHHRRRRISSPRSTASSGRRDEILTSPSWRRGGSRFVRQSGGNVEDPFVSRTSVDQTNQENEGQNAEGVAGPATPAAETFLPREDRAGLPLSAETAQAILPPNACVFVANLSSSQTDDQLEHSVHEAFQTFGNVYVKIRRDNRGMPFAFCQYEHVSDSERAIRFGRGLIIDGRACRTERAKVNRSLYLSRVTGGHITEEEARAVLTPYGAVETCWHCSQTDKVMFRLPDGIWAMFAFFQDCRDAQNAFRDDSRYRLEQPPMPEDIQARLGRRGPIFASRRLSSPVIVGGRNTDNHTTMSPSAMSRRFDRFTIFVGNLPLNVTQEQLLELFGGLGRIRSSEIVYKVPQNTNAVNVFAFLEFATEEEARRALSAERYIDGVRLRIELKDSQEPTRRVNPVNVPFTNGSPLNRRGNPAADTASMLYVRALNAGVPQATMSYIFDMNTPHFQEPVFPYPYYSQNAAAYPQVSSQWAHNHNEAAELETPSGYTGNAQYHGTSLPMHQPMSQLHYAQTVAPYSTYAAPHYPPNPPYVYPPPENTTDHSAPPAGEEGQ